MPEVDFVDAKGKPITDQSMTDLIINAEVLLPQGKGTHMAKVVKQALDKEDQMIGSWNENPILSTLVYDVEFPDGTTKIYAANVIAENLSTSCGLDGDSTTTMASILNHKRDRSAVPISNKYIETKKGQ